MTPPDISTVSALQSEEHAKLLDDIDDIRSTVLRHDLSLPQIVVCGDQSSGKSSVLEAISHATFPVRDGRCTRFPTEIVLRRGDSETAVAMIQPGQSASDDHKAELKNFRWTNKKLSELTNLVEEAERAIGISESGKGWSDDILRLEITGPSCPQLTLVDLPGLIHTTKQMTNEHVLVKHLVRSYMEDRRSIILLVVEASSDPERQVALELARQVDPQGNRTMGVLTKPDTLERDSVKETSFFKIVEAAPNSQEFHLGLGWHVVRNLKDMERTNGEADRDARECELLAQRPWNRLPSRQLGIESLRRRLSTQLLNHIQAEIPSVVRDIETALNESSEKLRALGTARDTPGKQRSFLLTMTAQFHDIVKATCDGHWDYGKLQNSPERRLRARLRSVNDKFASKMRREGHTYEVKDDWGFGTPKGLTTAAPIYMTLRQRIEDIDQKRKASLGRELPGTPTPALVGSIFREQSRKWESIAKDYVEECWTITEAVLETLLLDCCGLSVFGKLFPSLIMPDLRTRHEALATKLQELLSPYVEHHPSTLSPHFQERLQELEIETDEEGSLLKSVSADVDVGACLRLWRTTQAFYDTALITFVDNVSSLAVENCLIRGLADILTSARVNDMDDDQLKRLAGDSQEDIETRQRLTDKVKSLMTALDTCRLHERTLPRYESTERQGLAQELETQMPGQPTAQLFDFSKPLRLDQGESRKTSEDTEKAKLDNKATPSSSEADLSATLMPKETLPSLPTKPTFFFKPTEPVNSLSAPKVSPRKAGLSAQDSTVGGPSGNGKGAGPSPALFGSSSVLPRGANSTGSSFSGFGTLSMTFACAYLDDRDKARTSVYDAMVGQAHVIETGPIGRSTHISFFKDLSPEEIRLNDYTLIDEGSRLIPSGTLPTMDNIEKLKKKLVDVKFYGKD